MIKPWLTLTVIPGAVCALSLYAARPTVNVNATKKAKDLLNRLSELKDCPDHPPGCGWKWDFHRPL
jgi:hypothetical protein